jgi:hypothetical protein
MHKPASFPQMAQLGFLASSKLAKQYKILFQVFLAVNISELASV